MDLMDLIRLPQMVLNAATAPQIFISKNPKG